MAVDWNQVKADIKDVYDSMGSDADLTLRDGTQFTLKATQGHRTDAAMTAGLDQSVVRIRVLYDDWHNAAGADRAPEKGDRVSMWGRNHAVDTVHPRAVNNVGLVYVLLCRG